MVLLISLLVGIQVLFAWAGDPSPNPEPQPFIILYPPCNSSEVEEAADLALKEINAHRTEGYVFTLRRIFSVAEVQELSGRAVEFILFLDVLETNCHVLSRESYKNCTIRPPHETVYGQCVAILFINKEQKITLLGKYVCSLWPVAPADVARICPDCPVPGDPTAARFQDAAAASLAKFNAENNHDHYFRLLNVTKGTSEWIYGPKTYVEYTIQETSCSKNGPRPDLSKCPFHPLELADVGVCKGSVTYSKIEHREFVTYKCKLYSRPLFATQEEGPKPGKAKRHVDDENHEDGHHRNGKRHHHHPHHRKPHHRHHGTNSHEQQREQTPSDTFQCPPKKTVGQVMIFPPSSSHVSLHSLPPISIPLKYSFPDIQGALQEHHPQPDKPGQANFTMCSIPLYHSFLASIPDSDHMCPGNTIIEIPGLPFTPPESSDDKHP